MDLYPLFDWLDTSLLADIAKAYGGVFAVVQMFHLLGMSILGGMVLVGDLRLLNVVMKDTPSEVVIESTHKWFGKSRKTSPRRSTTSASTTVNLAMSGPSTASLHAQRST